MPSAVRIWRWRWGPLERPVLPDVRIWVPAAMVLPAATWAALPWQ